MSFWDVCDLHLNLSYQSIGNDTYGDFKRDAPISLIKSAFIFMKMTYSHPDFILVNGDNVYHGENNFTEILQTVSFTIRDEFPLTTVLPTLGNHDVQPRNIFAVNSTWCVQLFDFWKTFLVSLNTSDINSFKKGCFYSQTIDSPKNYTVLVIVLNTLVWYSRNQIDESIEDPLGQFSWLEEKLQYARKSQTKVFIAGHVPPGASEYSTRLIEHLLPKYNERFLTILQKYSDIIAAGFFAHQHTDAFKIVYNDKDQPVIPLFQSPSITPFYLNKLGSVNPSVRFYEWNEPDTKYFQYHTTLTMNKDQLDWSLEYVSRRLLPDLTATSLENLLKDISLKKSRWFDKFFSYHLSGRLHDDQMCSAGSHCRCQFYCVMKNLDYVKLKNCLKDCPLTDSASSKLAIVLPIVIVTVLIFIIVALVVYFQYYRRRSVQLQSPDAI